MEQPIIEVENLSKLYRLGVIGATTLQDSVERCWYRMRGKEEQLQKVGTKKLMIEPDDPQAGLEPNSIWALKDVSFSVQRGEIVGFIGKNGAGKSTLLKILTRITEPTSGQAIIRGRVASLLEVGTGFHPELTGRENVYLNGAILGMRKAEINDKIDEIVEFSGIENFIDTPVKRYSSGMYVRLAFAVAAHLEPEILLVDEVLAVGDVEFQKKCLGKMKEVSKGGRTVLFVSHNMAAIGNLCKRCLLLDNGKIVMNDQTETVITHYLSKVSESSSISLRDRKDRAGAGKIRLTRFAMFDKQGNELDTLISGQYVEFRIYYESINNNIYPKKVSVGIGIKSHLGQFLALLSNEMVKSSFEFIEQKGYWSCRIERLPIAPMMLCLNLIVRQNNIIQDWIQEAVYVTVEAGDFYSTGRVTEASHGGFLIEQTWLGSGNS